MKAEIITTGEEVLSGQITDTNASWFSAELALQGIAVTRRTTVGDRMQDLVACFKERAKHADLIIVNGGLGPTVDDLSAAAAAEALGEPLVRSESWETTLRAKFHDMGRNMPAGNLKQADLPQSAEVINNPVGTACGFSIELDGAVLYFTPGVPYEMKRMFHDELLPRIRQRFAMKLHCPLMRLHCFGIAESRLDTLLQPIPLPQEVSLGFRAHLPTIEIKIMGKGENLPQLTRDMTTTAQAIRDTLGPHLLCEENETLESEVQRLMIENKFQLALAESCTGGMIASQLVGIAGSSAYFNRAFVTYTNEAKNEMVDVPMAVIEEHGAVSIEVVRHMAMGARQRAGCSHALSVSGVAGPDGGSEEKPVGTVAFGLATPQGVYAQMVKAPNWGRKRIRLISAALALDMLRRHLRGLPVFGQFDLTKTMATVEP